MVQQQDFKVVPNGVIRGGKASYAVNLETGDIAYSAVIELPLWQSKKSSGSYKIDPAVLKSSTIKKQGDKTTVGNVEFTCNSVSPGLATVSVVIGDIGGLALLNTSQEYLILENLHALGSAFGFQFNLQLEKI